MILQLRCFTGKTPNISRANHKANRSSFNNDRKESRTRTRRSALMEAAPIRSSPFGLLEQSPPLLQPLLAVGALRQSVRRRVRSHLYLLRVCLSRALARLPTHRAPGHVWALHSLSAAAPTKWAGRRAPANCLQFEAGSHPNATRRR